MDYCSSMSYVERGKYYNLKTVRRENEAIMDQMQPASAIPHLVQVYQASTTPKIQNPQIIHISHPSLTTSQGKVTYQQTITSNHLNIPVTQEIGNEMLSQNQIVMSCHQHIHSIQPLQTHISSQVIQGSDIPQSLHVILPQVPMFKQHMLVNSVQQQYYGQYEYAKECIVGKAEPELQLLGEKDSICKSESIAHIESGNIRKKKRLRSQIPNPNMWACNVRKLKHQHGEAYISRRGKYVPERNIRTTKDCLKSCKYKCSERINDSDREHLFKAFYSLNANEKKHFLLNTTERNHVRPGKYTEFSKRKYSFKYFFLVRAVRYTVCKNFYLGTLAISQKPVYNVHLGKSDMNIPKPDGRGLSEASTHTLPSEIKDNVRKHIMSFSTVDSKPVKQFSKKKQYLENTLSIKQMYTMYSNVCSKENLIPVKESMYRKIFKQEFNLHFEKLKEQLCCKCKGAIRKK